MALLDQIAYEHFLGPRPQVNITVQTASAYHVAIIGE